MNVIAVGFDLVDVRRVERMWERYGDRAARRLLTPAEGAYCNACAVPARHIAARLAAKEAAFKAMAGNALAKRIGWFDLEVVHEDAAAPVLQFHGAAAQRATQLGVTRSVLTLTHTDVTAGAVVILLGQ